MSEVDLAIELSVAEARISHGTRPSLAAYGTSTRMGSLLRRAGNKRHVGGRHDAWSPEHKEYVRQMMGYMTFEEIGAMCGGRSAMAVRILIRRNGWPAASKKPHELTACQVAKLMGVCGKLVIRLIELGILPGRVLPGGKNIHVVQRAVLDGWLINPMNWIYFKPLRILDPRLRRLVALAQARWPDKWLTTGQAAKILGLKNSHAVHARIKRGQIPGRRWNNWLVLRSDIEHLDIVPGKGSPGRSRIPWSKAGDRFLKKCVRAGKGWREIGRLMGPMYSERRGPYRYAQLQRAR